MFYYLFQWTSTIMVPNSYDDSLLQQVVATKRNGDTWVVSVL